MFNTLKVEQKTTETLKFELTDLRFKASSEESTEQERAEAQAQIQEIEKVLKERV